jgi:hypothetical protein
LNQPVLNNAADIARDGFRQGLGVGDDDDFQRRVMTKQPSRRAHRAEHCLQVAGRQVKDEPKGLSFGKLAQFVGQVTQIRIVADRGAVQAADGLAREGQKIAR